MPFAINAKNPKRDHSWDDRQAEAKYEIYTEYKPVVKPIPVKHKYEISDILVFNHAIRKIIRAGGTITNFEFSNNSYQSSRIYYTSKSGIPDTFQTDIYLKNKV